MRKICKYIAMLDQFDRALIKALQQNGQATNAELAALVGLSVSQAGRRRHRLEAEGVITHYRAQLSAEAVGLQIQAFIQISLTRHSRESAQNLHSYLQAQPEILNIWSLTGSADYLLQIYCASLPALNHLVHEVLLSHETITHVESKIVMEQIKSDGILMPAL